jgi:uncharacterized protein YdbL (DUF1318 family)
MSERNQYSSRIGRRPALRLGALGLGLLALSLCLFRFTADANAESRLLDAPRAAGTVGERFDGYAVARGTPTADLAALIAKVNAERQAIYQQRAAAEKVPVDAIGRIYAAEIMKSAPAGTWFLSESGNWTQK